MNKMAIIVLIVVCSLSGGPRAGIGYEQSQHIACNAYHTEDGTGRAYEDSCEAADEVDYIMNETERLAD